MRKLIASSTIAASLIAGGATAVVLAPTIAGAQDSSDAGVDEATGLTDVLAELVADGTLSQDQADAVTEALREAHQEGRLGHRHRGLRGLAVRDAFEDLGIDADTVRAGIEDGLTPGEIAAANGASPDALADALAARANAHIDRALENDRIDTERATELREQVDERVAAFVSGEVELRTQRNRQMPRRFGHSEHDSTDESTGA